MLRRFHSLILIFCTFLISSCSQLATKPDSITENSTYNSFQDMRNFQKILYRTPKEVQITKNSPIFIFDEGKGYFEAIDIGESESKRFLELRSFSQGIFTATSYYLYPCVIFLDHQLKPIAKVSPENLSYKFNHGSIKENVGTLVGVVTVPKGSRYGVIYSPANMVGKKKDYKGFGPRGMIIVGTAAITLPAKVDVFNITFGSIGKLIIELTGNE